MRPRTRPALRPGLRLLGSASGHDVLVEHDRVYPLDEVTAALLRRLDGTVGEADVLAAATPAQLAAWSRLTEAGVVVDLEAPTRLARDLDVEARAQGLCEASALVAHNPAAAAHCWRLRRAAHVVVTGTGAVAAPLVRLLRESGIGEVGDARGAGGPRRRDPDVTVLADDHEPATDAVERLMREALVHLVAGLRGGTGVVGPLVVPGATPCLHCVDVTRSQRDRAWAGVREQVSRPERCVVAPPAAGAVTTAVAALAAAEVLARVEGRAAVTTGATASLTLAAPLPSLRRWPVQPACGCAWHAFSAAQAAQGEWSA